MNRLSFIKKILLGAAGLSIPTKTNSEGRKIFLSKFYIAGFSYYDGDIALKTLKENDRLIIKYEPDNPYDHRALEVYTTDRKKLGYVPRTENPIPSRLIRQNIKLTGEVEKINYNEEDWKKVKIRLYMAV
ncbi:HIRAN domain-containing protein [Melioribacteraceae bacterium 4301-Me]|uniref:HIRAN domain-containing protein n=1 Tax=Pyranulibacter aquaticus TaxID=3163344 RepID=UPI003599D3BC